MRTSFHAENRCARRTYEMTPTIERLNETYTYRRHFRDRHRLIRPARQFEGWVKFVALAVIYIVIESAMNSFMFSRGNESGLLGGLLTSALSWHWIFLINLPIGVLVYALCLRLIPRAAPPGCVSGGARAPAPASCRTCAGTRWRNWPRCYSRPAMPPASR